MSSTLSCHPETVCSAALQIDALAARMTPHWLRLRYILSGDAEKIAFPARRTRSRTDELWRNTCFEAFLRETSCDAYYEFNFAPSTKWAAYRFEGYRQGMAVADEISTPEIETTKARGSFILDATVSLERTELKFNAPWSVGLSVVIEETNGAISYWALAHGSGAPDFHHADCFALQIATEIER